MRVTGEGGVEVGDHEPHALLREDASAAVGPAVEQGLAQHGKVVDGGEDPGVPGDAVEGPGVLVVHRAPHQPARRRRLVLGGGDLGAGRPPVRDRVVAGRGHPQRRGDPLAHDPVQALPGEPLDEDAEGDEVEVAVEVDGAGRVLRRLVHHRLDPRGHRVVVAPQREVGLEPRGVGEALAHRHRLLAVRRELRQVARDRRLELDEAGLDELHDGDRGEQLGARGQVVDGAAPGADPLRGRGQPLVVLPQVGVAARVVGDDAAVVPHDGRGAGVERPPGGRAPLPRPDGRHGRGDRLRHEADRLGPGVAHDGRGVAEAHAHAASMPGGAPAGAPGVLGLRGVRPAGGGPGGAGRGDLEGQQAEPEPGGEDVTTGKGAHVGPSLFAAGDGQ